MFTASLIAPAVAYVYKGQEIFCILDDRNADKPRADAAIERDAHMIALAMNAKVRRDRAIAERSD